MFACLHGPGDLTALAREFSPVVEETGAGTVAFDVSGLDRLFGHPQDLAAAIARRAAEMQVKANLALADNPDAAICAARGFPGVHVIPRGDESKFLGELPIHLLEPSAELRDTLARWGIRRFRDLAALPPLGIAERLGPEGLRLRERARGEAERKLAPLEEPQRRVDHARALRQHPAPPQRLPASEVTEISTAPRSPAPRLRLGPGFARR